MHYRPKRWVVRDPAPAEALAALPDYNPLLANLLVQRGIRTSAEAARFLDINYRNERHDPLVMLQMREAAGRIIRAIQQGERMAVYGDFDADGVTAVALLMRAIPALGGTLLHHYIPNREEGYGLNPQAIRSLYDNGVRLLITVDCGISNVAEIRLARELGIDVIVTDHHTPPSILPADSILVNPKQPGCPYPFKDLVGVGIAFKLVHAICALAPDRRPAELSAESLLDLVALGTITDMGPLLGENRALVRSGLAVLNQAARPGLRALIEAAGLRPGDINAAAISFALGPRINAAGRISDAKLAYDLLLATDDETARSLAQQLNDANRLRQDWTKTAQEEAELLAAETGRLQNPIVVLESSAFPAGIIGLVAGRLVESWGRPVLLLAHDEQSGECRGSARSVPGFSIVSALEQCSDLLIRFGGHSQAAGLTVEHGRVPELEQRLLELAARQLADQILTPTLTLDAEVRLSDLTWDLMNQLERLEPFGQANPQPSFLSRNVRVIGVWARGVEGRTLKLRLGDGRGSWIDAIGFRMGELAEQIQRLPFIDVAYRLEINEWNGDQNLQLRLLDVRL